MISEFFIQ